MSENKERINYFKTKFTKTHFEFACLASVPIIFSVDLLYNLYQNFIIYEKRQNQIESVIISDLVLSSLCENVEDNIFRMNEEVSSVLKLEVPITQQKQIARFVEEYALRNKSFLNKNIFDSYSIWAMRMLRPAEMERKIIERLKESKNDYEKISNLNLYFSSLSSHKEGEKGKMGISLKAVENKEEEGVLQIPLPNDFLDRVIPLKSADGFEKVISDKSNSKIFLLQENKEKEYNLIIKDSNLLTVLVFASLETAKCNIRIENCENCSVFFITDNENLESNIKIDAENVEVITVWDEELIKQKVLPFYSDFTEEILHRFILLFENIKTKSSKILRLEKKLGISLTKTTLEKCSSLQNSYSVDDIDEVIGLNLSNNNLSEISFLSDFPNLNVLYLEGNDISDILPIRDLNNIELLDFRNNKVKKIPGKIFDIGLEVKWELSKLPYEGIYIAGNPLQDPPIEVVKNGNESIREYLLSSFDYLKYSLIEITRHGHTGFGCLIDKDGFILTSSQAVGKDIEAKIKFWNTDTYFAGEVVENNSEFDFAIIKIAKSNVQNFQPFPLRFSKSNSELLCPDINFLKGEDKILSCFINSYEKFGKVNYLRIDFTKITKDVCIGAPLFDIKQRAVVGFYSFYKPSKTLGSDFKFYYAVPFEEAFGASPILQKVLKPYQVEELFNIYIEKLYKEIKPEEENDVIESTRELISKVKEAEVKDKIINALAGNSKLNTKLKLVLPLLFLNLELDIKLPKTFDDFKQLFNNIKIRIKNGISKTTGSPFIKEWNLSDDNKKLLVYYFDSYEEYEAKPESKQTFKQYRDYFRTGDRIAKILMGEPIRLLRDIDELNEIYFKLPFGVQTYEISITREQVENYFNISLLRLKDLDLWREEFADKYLYEKNLRRKFNKDFVKTTSLEIFEEKGIYIAFKGDREYYPVFPEEVERHSRSMGDEIMYSDSIVTMADEEVIFEFWEYSKGNANHVEISHPEIVETTEEALLNQFQEWLYNKDFLNESEKPRTILIIEQKLNITFSEIDIDDIFEKGKGFTYSVDFENNLIGLQLSDIQVNNILSLIGTIKTLKVLKIFACQCSDISPLIDLTNLKQLNLHGNRISDISTLPISDNLTHLSLYANSGIDDISKLSVYKNLEVLYLNPKNIDDISALSGLTNLKRLALTSTRVNDFSPLKKLQNLEFLNLGGNKIKSIDVLQDMKKLIMLGLVNCDIKYLPEWLCDFGLEFITEDTEDNKMIEGHVHLLNNPIFTPPLRVVTSGRETCKKWYSENIFVKYTDFDFPLCIEVDDSEFEKGSNEISKRYDGEIYLPDKTFRYCTFIEDPIGQASDVIFPNQDIIETLYEDLLNQYQTWLDRKYNIPKNHAIHTTEIKYTTFKEEKLDIPIKSQIEQSILIEGTFSKEQFEEFFQKYSDKLKRKRSKYHKGQTHLFLYFFDTKKRASHNWFARYEYMKDSTESFSYNKTLLALFDNDDSTYTVPNDVSAKIPQQFSTVLKLLETLKDYNQSNNTLQVLGDNHYQISELAPVNQAPQYIEEAVKRSLVYTAYQVFIHSASNQITLTSVPLQVDFKNQDINKYLYDYAKTVHINRQSALDILRNKANITDFYDLVDTDLNDSINGNFNSIIYNDAGKPTLNVIWKEFEKFIEHSFEADRSERTSLEYEAERLVTGLLNNARWDYMNKAVTIFEYDINNTSEQFQSFDDLFNYLVDQAEGEVINQLSGDNEIDEIAMESFSAESIVESVLYNTVNSKKLNKIGWEK